MARQREVIGVSDHVPVAQAIPLGIQHMMSMFGSTVLVPILTGLHPSVAIMCSGIGTVCYLLMTKNKIPSYLGSSFAFISPIVAVGATQGLDAALSGIFCAGLVFLAVAGIIKLAGTAWIDRILPPVLIASIIVVIGIGLSATAVNMALNSSGDGFNAVGTLVAGVTLFAAVGFSSMKGLIGTIPVLLAIVVGIVLPPVIAHHDKPPGKEPPGRGRPRRYRPHPPWAETCRRRVGSGR